jgi:hypothetical protein
VASEGAPAINDRGESDSADGHEHPTFDTSVAHVARVYDYWLGGKDNYAADREAGDQAIQADPNLVYGVRANREFLSRTVRYLASECGIRQFLDVGTGIPTANNTHEVAQSVAPDCRVVYADNDPIVLSHARALLTSSPQGATDYIEADLRDTASILDQAALTLDFSRPVAIMLIAILHHIGDEDDPYGIVAQLMGTVPAGSYLAVSHMASDIQAMTTAEAGRRLNRLLYQKVTYRTHADIARFFDGLDIVEPGVVRLQEWRPGTEIEKTRRPPMWGGVGRKG